MLKLTQAVKDWCVDNCGLTADATDEEFGKAAADAIVSEKLTLAAYKELAADPDENNGKTLIKLLERMDDRLGKLEGKGSGETPERSEPSNINKAMAESTPGRMNVDDPQIREISVEEMFDGRRTAKHFPEFTQKGMKHPKAGQRLYEGTRGGANSTYRPIDEPSELDQAVSGAIFKWKLHHLVDRKDLPLTLRMTDLDWKLIKHALHKYSWAGVMYGIDGSEEEGAVGVKNRKLSATEIKALIDDGGASGALEMAPIVFDDMIITIPLLHGEFFPMVNVVNITRGRRIEGASIANVTINSGGVDGTAIDLENTANFITAFDTTIFVCDGAIEIGLDFLSDSPVDVAGLVTTSYGEQLLAWLDEQICIGDGTTEPEGITVATGTATVNADNGAGGPPTVGDYESLLFGVSKAYKRGAPTNRIAYGSNETTYQRARGIAVGASDQRRVFGMDHESYMTFGHPHGINENFTNRQIVFANFMRYRMYRRLGLSMRQSTEGRTLIRNNYLLISARARFGGQLEDGNAAAVQADGQS